MNRFVKIIDGGGRLFDLCSQAVHNIDIFGFLKKRFTGVAILETVLTLPIILYTILFSIELIRMGLAQVAVDSITKECTFSLMAKGTYNDFDSIFLKHKPWGIPIGYFRYYIRIYKDFHTDDNKGLMDVFPYGGETIIWVGSDYANPTPVDKAPVARNYQAGTGSNTSNPSDAALYSKYKTKICAGLGSEVAYIERPKLLNGTKNSSGYIFVLTVTVKFPFSSSFVAKLFNGGSNTDKDGVYILWARGSGIIN